MVKQGASSLLAVGGLAAWSYQEHQTTAVCFHCVCVHVCVSGAAVVAVASTAAAAATTTCLRLLPSLA